MVMVRDFVKILVRQPMPGCFKSWLRKTIREDTRLHFKGVPLLPRFSCRCGVSRKN